MPAIWRVQESLNTDRSGKVDHGESKPIRFLREYSNYLTPRLGFLGADTWTAVAIYIRNVLLNQTILILFSFLPAAASVSRRICVAPRSVLVVSLRALSGARRDYCALLTAQLGVAKNMLHLTGEGPTGEFPPFARQGSVLKYIVVPLFLAAWCLTVWDLAQAPLDRALVDLAHSWSIRIGREWDLVSREIQGNRQTGARQPTLGFELARDGRASDFPPFRVRWLAFCSGSSRIKSCGVLARTFGMS